MTNLVPSGPVVSARVRPLDNEARLASAINDVADREFVPYLQEAWRCYTSRAYNAAVVWIWCAVGCYIRAVIRNTGEELFAFRYRRTYESLEHINDGELVETCKEMGILKLREENDRYSWVKQLRERRNDLAHGVWKDRDGKTLEATPEEVVNFATEAVRYFLRIPVVSHRLVADIATLKEFAAGRKEPVSLEFTEKLVEGVDRNRLLELCHDLLTLYRSDTSANLQNVRRFWRAVYLSLDAEKRESVNERVVRESARTLGLRAEMLENAWRFDPLPTEEADRVRSREAFLYLGDLFTEDVGDILPDVHKMGLRQLSDHFRSAFIPFVTEP